MSAAMVPVDPASKEVNPDTGSRDAAVDATTIELADRRSRLHSALNKENADDLLTCKGPRVLIALVLVLLLSVMVVVFRLDHHGVMQPPSSATFAWVNISGGHFGFEGPPANSTHLAHAGGSNHMQRLGLGALSLVFDVVVLGYHATHPLHPKFALLRHRRWCMKAHILGGLLEILFCTLAFFGSWACMGSLAALAAILIQVPTSMYVSACVCVCVCVIVCVIVCVCGVRRAVGW